MTLKIAIIDYEMGNLKSIYKCLKYLNIEAKITDNPKIILDSDGVILPGVGAFGDAMMHLKTKNLISIIKQIVKDNTPLFGICLGLHLLFSKGFEMGEFQGLDIIQGKVILFDKSRVGKIPQIGWNNVEFQNDNHFIIRGIPNNSYFYFVHSFYGVPKDKKDVLGLTKYDEIEFCSILGKDNIIATQFHPEKSSRYGIQIYRNFIDFCRK